MTKEKEKLYVDLRFYFKRETEEFFDKDGNLEESWSHLELDSVERIKLKGVDDDDLIGIGESFGQMDSYQFFLQSEVPQVIVEGGKQKLRD